MPLKHVFGQMQLSPDMHEDLVDLLNEDLREKRDVRSVRGLIEDLETAYTVQEQVVARHGFVQRENFRFVARSGFGLVGVDVVATAP